ncbi:thioredoxin reductase [Nitzschia inconspicua]|uniref:Thioredoxin reductase n=1 Tax=Nitzschia inconspicua TaxID=303405 RepID=A0A9K3PAC5_9STRA|nr:thioredoxin reductase [Nitzschia inconspicua]
MAHSSNVQQRRNIRSSSSSPSPIVRDSNHTTTTNRVPLLLPLTTTRNHQRQQHPLPIIESKEKETTSTTTTSTTARRRRRGTKTIMVSSSSFPFRIGTATATATAGTTGSLVVVLVIILLIIMILILVARETQPYHHHHHHHGETTKQHDDYVRHHSSTTTFWMRLFPFPFIQQQQSRDVRAQSIPQTVRLLQQQQLEEENVEIYDVAIAGAGVAGLSAALFAARAGLKVIVLGSSQGLLSQTKRLDNFPSFLGHGNNDQNNNNNNDNNTPAATGPDWLQATTKQAKDFGATFAPPGLLASSIEQSRIIFSSADTTSAIDRNSSHDTSIFFTLSTPLNEYHAWAVIVASGATPKTLGLPHEQDLWGVTLHNCAICDGHLYSGKDKHVLVVGGGDAALDAAIMLARYAGRVTLVHRRNEFTSANNPVNLQVVHATRNVEILTPFVVDGWKVSPKSSSQLVGATLRNSETDAKRTIDIDGAFVMIGATPNTEWLKSIGLAMDEEGLIHPPAVSDESRLNGVTQTSIPGIFAAGEVSDHIYKQAITAAASGAAAAIDAERWLREHHKVMLGAAHPQRKSNDVVPTTRSHERNDTQLRRRKEEQLRRSNGQAYEKQPGLTTSTDRHDDATHHGGEGCDLTKSACIRTVVKKYPVVVFSKPWCPYCRKALEALSLAGMKEPHIINLSQYPNSPDIQSALQKITGRRTVPNVFVNGSSIGGGDETVTLQRSGKLQKMIQQVVASSSSSDGEPKQVLHGQRDVSSKVGLESCDLASEICFKEIIQEYPVVMFSLSWCPECKQSLELLAGLGVKPHIVDLGDYKPISEDIRYHMLRMTGRRSVPNLFIGGEFIGGYKRTAELHEKGELLPKIHQVVGISNN